MRTLVNLLFLIVGVILLTAVGSYATTVNWNGHTWDNDHYGNTISVDLNGNLVIGQVADETDPPWVRGEAHYATDTAFQAQSVQSVEFSFNDTDFVFNFCHAPGPRLQVQGPTISTSEIATCSLDVPVGQPTYGIYEQVGEGGLNGYTPAVPWTGIGAPERSSGLHKLTITKGSDGYIQYYVDSYKIATSTIAVSYISDVRFASYSNPLAPRTSSPVDTTFLLNTTRNDMWKGQEWNTLAYGNTFSITNDNMVVRTDGDVIYTDNHNGSVVTQTSPEFQAGAVQWVQTTCIDNLWNWDGRLVRIL